MLTMILHIFIYTVAVVCIAEAVSPTAPNQCPQPTDGDSAAAPFYYANPYECKSFYQCDNGVAVLKYCGDNTVWNDDDKTCVIFNSYLDTCTQRNVQRECARPEFQGLLIANPTVCSRFFNCSSNSGGSGMQNPFQHHEVECTYPDMFDITQKKCVSYWATDCGSQRIVYKNPCDYLNNKCWFIMCEPCESRLPSCVELSDGNHKHPLKLWSPKYIVCYDERLTEVRSCDTDIQTNYTSIYSPTKEACVSLWEIPRENGGLAPTCDGKLPGQYRTTERSDVYYSCPSARVSYCGNGIPFNESSRRCEPSK
uniref:Chitin-binding type-2 domain-containing protein n=1 Tax=Arion vulgaris TaxID=1028688 RepID=A0A0B7A681_9EUPU